MVQRFLELRDAICLFQNSEEGQLHGFFFSSPEFTMAEETARILKPIYDVTVEISGEKYVTGKDHSSHLGGM